jgi:hypothetical protein
MLSPDAPHSIISSDASGECPFNHDTDNCEVTCCCAEYVPLPALTEIRRTDLVTSLLPDEPSIALPRLIDRIFVPPQNRS